MHKQPIHPEKHQQHIQGGALKMIPTLISNSLTKFCVYRVKSHVGTPGKGLQGLQGEKSW
eukprot:487012-Pelagomonas_calceolata.AAC.2